MFPDLKIHSRSHRMVDCCVFVTISYSVTLLPVQIHVMGKAEGSKTKVKPAISKWNKNEIFQKTLLALKRNANARHTAAKSHKIRNQKWGVRRSLGKAGKRRPQNLFARLYTVMLHWEHWTRSRVFRWKVADIARAQTPSSTYYNLGSSGGAATLQITNVRRTRGGAAR